MKRLFIIIVLAVFVPLFASAQQGGRSAVVNFFHIKNNGSVEMTFGDPASKEIMPRVYRQENLYGYPPEGFNAWGFYQINIYRQ